MRIKREHGQFDKISFSLCIYIAKEELYEKIAFLLESKALQHKKSIVRNKSLTHKYYFSIDLEQDFHVEPLLISLNEEIINDENLKERFKIYCDITSEYDHCGIEIPSDSKIFDIQRLVKCSVGINVITI